MQKIALMIVPEDISRKLSPKFYGIGDLIGGFFPSLEEDLKATDLGFSKREYLGMAVVNSIFFSFLVGMMVFLISYMKGQDIMLVIAFSILTFLGFFLAFTMLLIRYPSIMALKKSEKVDMNLVFALKDVQLQIASGIDLYAAMQNVAEANYGEVSTEFAKVVKKIDVGTPMINALEEMAIKTKSAYLKRTVWQVINSLKSGSNLRDTLKNIIKDLNSEQTNKIRNYARELNLWSLLYLLFAVAVPSIGSTMLVILSSFAGFGLNQATFIAFIIISFLVQIILIGFIKSRRPMVDF